MLKVLKSFYCCWKLEAPDATPVQGKNVKLQSRKGNSADDDDDNDDDNDDDDVHPDNNDINDDVADSKVRHHYWLNSYRKLDRVIRYFLWTDAVLGVWME